MITWHCRPEFKISQKVRFGGENGPTEPMVLFFFHPCTFTICHSQRKHERVAAEYFISSHWDDILLDSYFVKF